MLQRYNKSENPDFIKTLNRSRSPDLTWHQQQLNCSKLWFPRGVKTRSADVRTHQNITPAPMKSYPICALFINKNPLSAVWRLRETERTPFSLGIKTKALRILCNRNNKRDCICWIDGFPPAEGYSWYHLVKSAEHLPFTSQPWIVN